MADIGLVVRPEVPEAADRARDVIAWAEKHGHSVTCESDSAGLLGLPDSCDASELPERCDPIVALGGDGTLIGVARYVENRSPVMIGVNFGRLGFLTEVAPSELLDVLEQVISKEATIGERNMLRCEVNRDGKEVFTSQAVNDGVIHKGSLDKLMDLDINVDNEKVMRLRADGLIVSTPTGSTAYSLSAGGPIAHPRLSVMLVTPICPHLLTIRPLILDQESEIDVTVPPYDGKIYLSIDGQVGFELEVGDTVRVRKAQNRVNFVRSPSRSYFEILRQKFSWGIADSESG